MPLQRICVWALAGAGLLSLLACSTPASVSAPKPAQEVRNVIFMMSDGTPPEAWALARWVKGQPLVSDGILTGAVQTYGADSIITDSAPAGTAFATGHKASDKTIGMAPWRTTVDAARTAAPLVPYRPLPNLLEAARLSGRATGLVVTANLQHASPTAFSAHIHDRNQYADIAYQQAHQHIDVMLGGGERHLLPQNMPGGTRADQRNVLQAMQQQGYQVVRSREALQAASGHKLLGLFAPDEMVYDLDREALAPTQPSLAEMTRKAIQTLSSSEKGRKQGFFLFIEGSKVDWAAHANDPAGVVSDLLAYDQAVQAALEFAKSDGNTLLISTSDHGTGGMSIGRQDRPDYATTDDDSLVRPLQQATLTGEGIAKMLGQQPSVARIKEVFAKHWSIHDLSEPEIKSIQGAPPDGWLQYVTGPILSRRAGIGWSTNGHTGGDAFLYSFGPHKVSGLWQNTALAHHMAKVLGLNLVALQDQLFTDLAPLAQTLGLASQLQPDAPEGPQMTLRHASGADAILMLDTSQMRLSGQVHGLKSLIIWSRPDGRVYVPQEAMNALRSHFAP